MMLHVDDHMVSRGHGVFDSCVLCEGSLYMLDQHITRLRLGAEMVGIPMPFSDAAIKRILLDTAAASLKLNGACGAIMLAWLSCAPADWGGQQSCTAADLASAGGGAWQWHEPYPAACTILYPAPHPAAGAPPMHLRRPASFLGHARPRHL